MTTIQDKVTYADGTVASGKIVLTWPPFQYGGVAIAAGQQEYPIAPDGTVTIICYPCIGSQPLGTYFTATYELDRGAVYDEYWLVPDTPTTTIGAIRVQVPATPSVMINAQQLTSSGAQSGMILGWTGSNWAPMFVSNFNCAVQSFNGRIGKVMPAAGDYSVGMVTGALADPTTTTGDLIVRGAAAVARLGVGGNGEVLVADNTQLLGMRWGLPPSAGVLSFNNRTGAVVPQAGDYTAAMVTGAVPQTTVIGTDGTLTGGGPLSGAIMLSVVPNQTVQQVIVGVGGTAYGTRHCINFIAGPGTSLSASDDPPNDRVDVTVSLSGSGPATPSIYAVNGTVIGTQPEVNFVTGTGITITGNNVAASNRVDLTITSTVTGGVTSFNTRTGAVVPVAGDYSAFYPSMTGSYANPAWIASLPYSKLTGAPTIPTVYWQAGSGGAIYYNGGHVGIGTATPAASFELHVVGPIAADQGSNVFTTLGIAANSSGSPTTFAGMWYDSTTNTLQIAALSGGVAWRNIAMAMGGGYVGVGMVPTVELEVINNGAIKVGSACVSSGIPSAHHAVFGQNAWYNGSGFVSPDTSYGAQIFQFYNNALYFLQAPPSGSFVTRWMVDSNGNFGIGNQAPQALLNVDGGAVFVTNRAVTNSRVRIYGGTDSGNASSIYIDNSASTNVVALTSSGGGYFAGRVGIGTTTPSQMLHVVGDIWVDPSGTNGASNGMDLGGFSGGGYINAFGAQVLMLQGNGGNVGIGTTTPQQKLDIDSSGYGDVLGLHGAMAATGDGPGITFQQNNYSTLVARIRSDYEGSVNGLGLQFWTYNGTSLQQRMQLSAVGNLGIGIVQYLANTLPWASLTVIGPAQSASLNAQTPANFSVSCSIGPELAFTCSGVSPYPISLQARHNSTNGYTFPLALNPLGGQVTVNMQNPTTAAGVVFAVTGRTNLIAAGEPYALRLDYSLGSQGFFLGVTSGHVFQLSGDTGGVILTVDVSGNLTTWAISLGGGISANGNIAAGGYLQAQSTGVYFPDGTLQTTAWSASAGFALTPHPVSKSTGTTYQNTTGKQMIWNVSLNLATGTSLTAQVGTSSANTPIAAVNNPTGGYMMVSLCIPVPNNYYFQANYSAAGGPITCDHWVEWY